MQHLHPRQRLRPLYQLADADVDILTPVEAQNEHYSAQDGGP